MKILGIETSCDETAAAVVEDGYKLLSNVVSSSVDLHKLYGGVVPEIAARSHVEVIIPVFEEALDQAGCTWDDIDAIAVTRGPGLLGSLLIGVMTARGLAIAKNKPLYAINHVEGHIYANFITNTKLDYKLPAKAPALPLLAMIVSGGHSHLIYLKDHGKYEVIGRTLDDAVGEAYDKVAKILGLPYPGGPSVDQAARHGDSLAIKLPKANMENSYDFSFSGLKTAVLRAGQALAGKDYTLPSYELPQLLSDAQKANLAASFQYTANLSLANCLKKAVDDIRPKSVAIGGGVAASQSLRQTIDEVLKMPVDYTDMRLCTDNAAMIAACAFYKVKNTSPTDVFKLEAEPNLIM